MAKFRGKKIVAFVAAEDISSNMYTLPLEKKGRVKYTVYLITDGSIVLPNGKADLFDKCAKKIDIKYDDIESIKSIATKEADKSTGVLFIGACLESAYEKLRNSKLPEIAFGIGFSNTFSAQNVDFCTEDSTNNLMGVSSFGQDFLSAISEGETKSNTTIIPEPKCDLSATNESDIVNVNAKKTDSIKNEKKLEDIYPEYDSVVPDVNDNNQKTDNSKTHRSRSDSRNFSKSTSKGTQGKTNSNEHVHQKTSNTSAKEPGATSDEVNIHLLEEEIFGTSITSDNSQNSAIYSPLQDAKATLFSELMQRLMEHIKLYTGLELKEDQLFQFSVLLEKTGNADEFNQNWNVSEPIYKVGLKDDEFIRLKSESTYFDKISKMIYGDDLWDY